MDTTISVFSGIAVAVIIFLVMRGVWCWYFRINEIVDLLKAIAQKLGAEIPDKTDETHEI